MKRQGNLIEKIADIDNLYLAYCKAKRGKEGRAEVIRYAANFSDNIEQLRVSLLNNCVNLGEYRYVKIYDPKERIISISPFADRVMQHAIINICHQNFENYQVANSYASRKGMGTYAAIDKAKLYQRRYKWFLKLDMRKYFDSIDHVTLKSLLRRRFKDRVLLEIFDAIIDGYATEPQKGLPIGNLSSQYFANHYLAVADHFLLEQLHVTSFVRYMDDIVIWSNDKEFLLDTVVKFRQFVESNLFLSLKPICLNCTERGLPFLGYIIYPNRMMLGKISKRRFIRKSKVFTNNLVKMIWGENEYLLHITPLLAYTQRANTYQWRNTIFNGI